MGGAFSWIHWVIVLVVVLVLFGGGGKISRLMGDFGKGLKSFKKNIKDETPSGDGENKAIEDESARVAETSSEEKDRATSG